MTESDRPEAPYMRILGAYREGQAIDNELYKPGFVRGKSYEVEFALREFETIYGRPAKTDELWAIVNWAILNEKNADQGYGGYPPKRARPMLRP
jgi:hypothetical protein